MKNYNRSSNIKIALFIIGISTIFIIFWINGIIIKNFRKEIKNHVEHLAVAYSNAIHTDEGDVFGRYVITPLGRKAFDLAIKISVELNLPKNK